MTEKITFKPFNPQLSLMINVTKSSCIHSIYYHKRKIIPLALKSTSKQIRWPSQGPAIRWPWRYEDMKSVTTVSWNAQCNVYIALEIVLALWWLVKPKLATIRDESWQTSLWALAQSGVNTQWPLPCTTLSSHVHWPLIIIIALWLAVPIIPAYQL